MEGVVTTMNKDREEPSISIVIPVYNQAGTIADTIESAIKALAGEPFVEIVVSENHSTDGTSAIVDSFSELIRIVRPDSHLGMAANWNFAVQSCSGDWVGMLSGDDRILPGYVSAIRKAISKSDNSVFAYGGWFNVCTLTEKKVKRRVLSMPIVSGPKRTVSSLLLGPKASFCAFCFSRKAFDSVGGFDEQYHLVQDWIMQFKLGFVGDFVKSNALIAEYRPDYDRTELEQRRAILYVSDIVLFCNHLIWQACDIGIAENRVLESCKRHVANLEKRISHFPANQDQAENIIMPLYELIGRRSVADKQLLFAHRSFRSLKDILRSLAELIIR